MKSNYAGTVAMILFGYTLKLLLMMLDYIAPNVGYFMLSGSKVDHWFAAA
jgi:hypothetical protein